MSDLVPDAARTPTTFLPWVDHLLEARAHQQYASTHGDAGRPSFVAELLAEHAEWQAELRASAPDHEKWREAQVARARTILSRRACRDCGHRHLANDGTCTRFACEHVIEPLVRADVVELLEAVAARRREGAGVR